MTSNFDGLHVDCRHFRWDRPCAPHKATGVTCPDCQQHDPIAQRLVMVKLAAVGDVLRTTSMLPAIHKAYPRASILWVTAPNAAALFEGNPLVDEVLSLDDPGLWGRLQVEEFDVVLCPDADPDTARIAAAVRASTRVGFTMNSRGQVESIGAAAEHWFRMGLDDVAKQANQRTYQHLVSAVLGLPAADVREPILNPSEADQDRALALRDAGGHRGPWVGINTGAGGRWERKRWTAAHQRTLVAALADRGIGVLLMGGPEEAGTHEALIPSGAKALVRSAGTDHDYRQFAAIVGSCDVLVTGDTMALHVACAREVPTVALFGPTSAAEIELYGRGRKIVPPDLGCLGCYLPTCDVSPHCQELIHPDVVLDAVLELLDEA